MGATRPTARASGVTERLRRLDSDSFVAFCAALWRARGYEVERTGGRFVAWRSGERLVVLPRTSPGVVERLAATARRRLRGGRGALDADRADAPVSTVDVVVTPVEGAWTLRLAERHDARLVGPTALADLLLYGVSRTEADALTTGYLGASTATLLADALSDSDTWNRCRRPTSTALAAVVGVVCLVLAAGVAGVWSPAPTDTSDDAAPPLLTGAGVEPRSSAEPTAVPTDSDGSSASVAQYPPGVGEGYLDAWVLSRAHARIVSERSYRLIVRQSDTDALERSRRWDGVWQHAVVESEGTWLYSVVGYESRANDSALVQYTRYADGEFVYHRTDSRNGTLYSRYPHRVDDDGFGVHTDRSRRYILRYLTTTDVEVDRVSWRPDEYRLVATGRPAYVAGDVSNYTATAFVDESGFVSELTVEFTREDARDHDDESAWFRFEYAAVDDTTVHPPGWYDEARAETVANSTSG